MRFVAMYPGLGLGTVIKEKFVLALDGQRDQTAESVSVQFTRDYLTQDDIDFALQFFPEQNFRGRWMEGDEVTLEPLDERIGVYDTILEQEARGWSDEVREQVEVFIVSKPNYGQDFTQVEKIKVDTGKPWPSYDETHHFKIPGLAAEIGCLEEALAYEQANKNRDGVVAALEEKLAIPADAVAGETVVA